MNPLLHVTDVVALPGKRLQVTFSTGAARLVGLSEHLHGEVFEPLVDDVRFAEATLDPETRTVAWPNGADLAPEFLWDVGVAVPSGAIAA